MPILSSSANLSELDESRETPNAARFETEGAPRKETPPPQSSYIGKSMQIKGEVTGAEPLTVEGRMEGSISVPGAHVAIGRDAVVKSSVQCGEVIIRGTLCGNLTASDRVEVHSGGSLIGEVVARRISVEDGAYFKGSLDMRRPDPKGHLDVDNKFAKAGN